MTRYGSKITIMVAMNNTDNPYQSPDDACDERDESPDQDDYERGDFSHCPLPRTPFTIDLFRRRWFFRKEYYRLTVQQDALLMTGDSLESPIRISRSVAEKQLFWNSKKLLIKLGKRKNLFLKPIRGECFPLKYAMLICWLQMFEEEEPSRKRMNEIVRLFILGVSITITIGVLFFSFLALISLWINPPAHPPLSQTGNQVFLTICFLFGLFFTRMATKRIWGLYGLLSLSIIVFTLYIALVLNRMNANHVFISSFVWAFFAYSYSIAIFRWSRVLKHPLYKENFDP